MKKELLATGVLAFGVGVGSQEVMSSGDSRVEEEPRACEIVVFLDEEADRRQDAENLVSYRQAVDAERTLHAVMGFRPQNLDYYRDLYLDAVDRVIDGEDAMSEGFWKTPVVMVEAPVEEPSPEPSTTPIE